MFSEDKAHLKNKPEWSNKHFNNFRNIATLMPPSLLSLCILEILASEEYFSDSDSSSEEYLSSSSDPNEPKAGPSKVL